MKKLSPQTSKNLYFKSNNRDQGWIFPPTIDELIDEFHPVRFIDKVVNELNVADILATYKPGGTSCYHPKILIKLLIYGYLDRCYSSRSLERQCHENICYMWLCGMLKPDHVTISNFRSGKLKKSVKSIFGQVVKRMYDMNYLELKDQIVDGTKFESVANRYTYVWQKNIMRFKGNLEEKINSLFEEIESHISEEQASDDRPASEDPESEEMMEQECNSRKIKEKIKKYKSSDNKKVQRVIKKIEKTHLPKLESYEKKEQTVGPRGSYSKTDVDATFMRMKDDRLGDGVLIPAYNIQLSTENQFIVNYSIHQNSNDSYCYINHTEDTLELLKTYDLPKFENANGDSIYGTEQNYEYLENQQINNYLKFPNFHIELRRNKKKRPFLVDLLYYNEDKDYYVCPMGQHMTYQRSTTTKNKNGRIAKIRIYEARNCTNCPLRGMCYNRTDTNRVIKRNPVLERYKKQARNNLNSDYGLQLRSRRSIDVEPVFGHIKYNRRFSRFTMRGIPKINIELGLLAIAHNLKKMIYQLTNNQCFAFILRAVEALYSNCALNPWNKHVKSEKGNIQLHVA